MATINKTQPTFNYNHSRTKLARMLVSFDLFWLYFVIYLTITLSVLGVVLVLSGQMVGYYFLLVLFPSLGLLVWRVLERKALQKITKSQTIDDILEIEIAGRLPHRPTPIDLIEIISLLPAGHFFNIRFGITPKLLKDIAADANLLMDNIWREAVTLRNRYHKNMIDDAILLLAVIENLPLNNQILANLKLQKTDLYNGLNWLETGQIFDIKTTELQKIEKQHKVVFMYQAISSVYQFSQNSSQPEQFCWQFIDAIATFSKQKIITQQEVYRVYEYSFSDKIQNWYTR